MNGRLFLEPARDLIVGPTEAHWRAAAGRAYYAAFQEARAALERWGIAIPPRDNIHAAVRLKFVFATDPEARRIGKLLEDLASIRNQADYKLATPGRFRDESDTEDAINKATQLIAMLDTIESDQSRRAEVIATIRP